MTKRSFYAPADKLNPLFQQHLPQGRVQARDYAFFMKKFSFMQLHKQIAPEKKEGNRNNNG
jgi:hypothetical protein